MKRLFIIIISVFSVCNGMDNDKSPQKYPSIAELVIRPYLKVTAENLATLCLKKNHLDASVQKEVFDKIAHVAHQNSLQIWKLNRLCGSFSHDQNLMQKHHRQISTSGHIVYPINQGIISFKQLFQQDLSFQYIGYAQNYLYCVLNGDFITEAIDCNHPCTYFYHVNGGFKGFVQGKMIAITHDDDSVFLVDCEKNQISMRNRKQETMSCHQIVREGQILTSCNQIYFQDKDTNLFKIVQEDEEIGKPGQWSLKKIQSIGKKIDSLSWHKEYLIAFTQNEIILLSNSQKNFGNVIQEIPGKWKAGWVSPFGSWLRLQANDDTSAIFSKAAQNKFEEWRLPEDPWAHDEIPLHIFSSPNEDEMICKCDYRYDYRKTEYPPRKASFYDTYGIMLKSIPLGDGSPYNEQKNFWDGEIPARMNNSGNIYIPSKLTTEEHLLLIAIENCSKKGLIKQLQKLKDHQETNKSKHNAKIISYIEHAAKETPLRTAAHLAHAIAIKKLNPDQAQAQCQKLLKQCDDSIKEKVIDQIRALNIKQLAKTPELQKSTLLERIFQRNDTDNKEQNTLQELSSIRPTGTQQKK